LVSVASILEEWKKMNVTALRLGGSATTPVQFASKTKAGPLATATLIGIGALSGIPMASQAHEAQTAPTHQGSDTPKQAITAKPQPNESAKRIPELQKQIAELQRQQRVAKLDCKDTLDCYDKGYDKGYEQANNPWTRIYERKRDGSVNWQGIATSFLIFMLGGLSGARATKRYFEEKKPTEKS
jgi:hypothetical protein